ncbi:MAG TPA: GNAT family N-acetyltransferase [Clostridiaceae bacterium]|nr:GNAT family N-acetyltransferase [Clostridiaceae bacterium]
MENDKEQFPMETRTDRDVRFVKVDGKERLQDIRQLFREYAESLEIDLCFQNFEEELEALPGKYAAPEGTMILALVDGESAGCIALRKSSEGIAEMKRLFVRDDYRGLHIGKRLVQLILMEAAKLGYSYIRLDTLSTMKEAVSLYQSFGFYEIEPYIYNPIEDAKYMELKLEG